MTNAVEVRFLGSTASLKAATGEATALLERYGGAVDQAANVTVAAGVRERESLKQLAVAYQAAADSAVKGSDEQVVAAQRARDAQARLAATTRTTAAEQEAGWSKMTAGAAGYVKQIALFGAGFLGFEGLRRSVQAVLDAHTSIEQLDQAIRNVHATVQGLTPALERQAAASRELGFTDDETRQAEAELITAFGATKKALDELAVAENLSRARREDLATAAKDLILLQEGNTRAAKQYGLALPDLTSAEWKAKAAAEGLTVAQARGKVLYDELTPRIRDQAQAFANSPSGKIAEFSSEVNQLEVNIGNALLPTLTRYLTEADAWLAKSENQKRVTDDVQVAVRDLADALKTAYSITGDFLRVADPVAHALGGWKTVIEGLIALKFASVLSGWRSGLEGVEGTSGKLAGNLKSIAAMGTLTVGVDLLFRSSGDKGAKGFFESLFGSGLTGAAYGWRVGGPWGAGIGATLGMSLDIYEHLIKGAKGYKYHGGSEIRDVGHGVTYDAATGQYYWFHNGVMQAVSKKRAQQITGQSASQLTRSGKSETSKIVAEARMYGVGSGGTYKWGGGHGGVVPPGSKLDCSGYVWQVFTTAGFKGFPGTSETQWSTKAGPNWGSRRVDPSEAKPGDVVFSVGADGPTPGHVGIVVDGRGHDAQVMQYYETGKPPDTIPLGSIGDLVGIKQFFLIKKGAGTNYGPTPPSPGNSADKSSTTAKKKAIATGCTVVPLLKTRAKAKAGTT
jgi:cell wall-associated NlpC family hydrolase